MFEDCIFVKQKGSLKKLYFDHIMVLEAADNYVKFFTEEGTFLVRITMDAAVKSLPSDKFARVHRLYAVSIKEISKISDESLMIRNFENEIPVTKQFYFDFVKKIKILDADPSTKHKTDEEVDKESQE
ncbi:MAG TPA: LytTR family DNA-binding domain-containing protein [Bacteroidia bacterium]|nr:LytTR family DNA-binding domain-containing protein [Bacteroidia bacterium]